MPLTINYKQLLVSKKNLVSFRRQDKDQASLALSLFGITSLALAGAGHPQKA